MEKQLWCQRNQWEKPLEVEEQTAPFSHQLCWKTARKERGRSDTPPTSNSGMIHCASTGWFWKSGKLSGGLTSSTRTSAAHRASFHAEFLLSAPQGEEAISEVPVAQGVPSGVCRGRPGDLIPGLSPLSGVWAPPSFPSGKMLGLRG